MKKGSQDHQQEIRLTRKLFIRKSDNIKDFYDIEIKPMASGSYGAVHIATQKSTKEKRAAKIIPKYKLANIENFLSEVELLRLVDHPYIIRMYEWFEDKDKIYIVMDLCEGGELFDKISGVGHFTEQVAASLFGNMMSAVNYCTTRKICHKDLKPENFMFTDKSSEASIKLIDFGLSQIFEDPSMALLFCYCNRAWKAYDEG